MTLSSMIKLLNLSIRKVKKDEVKDNILRFEIELSTKQFLYVRILKNKSYRAEEYPFTVEHLLNPRFTQDLCEYFGKYFLKSDFMILKWIIQNLNQKRLKDIYLPCLIIIFII